MLGFSFPGTYEDGRGVDPVTWRIEPSSRPGWQRRYEIRTTIRGVAVWGGDLDGLSSEDEDSNHGNVLSLGSHGDLSDCVLRGDLPCTVSVGQTSRSETLCFVLDLRRGPDYNPAAPQNLRLSIELDGTSYALSHEWFEDGVQRLEATLPTDTRLTCCVTCLYSDYSPGGHGLMGMRCHRDAREQYLAVRSKADYWGVPVTEEVPETYLCPEYERRIPGTGYRG